MNINTTVAGLTDELSDYVGLKSGLVVTSSDVVRLLDRELGSTNESEWWYSPKEWLHDDPLTWVRLRAEDLESLVVRVLYAIGALASPWNQLQVLMKFASENPELVENSPPFPDEDEYPLPVTPWLRFYTFVHSRPHVASLPPKLAELVKDFERRSIIDLMFRTERVSWDGCVELRDLFDLGQLGGEILSSGAHTAPLIDQRFIDYLHAQPEDLSRMHWRQFEFLIGEFFRRNGYEVNVTPPSGDGGIDVQAVRPVGAVGPELILVQAKRFANTRQVGIETVKALWSDSDQAAATRGIVATTSTLAPGARAYCEARRYRLTAVERPIVEDG